jgi:hypothetical protein
MAKIAKIVIETDGELEDGKLTISLKEAKELQKLLNGLLEKEIVKEYVPYYPSPYVYEPYKIYPYTYPQSPYYTITWEGTNTDGEKWSGSDVQTGQVSVYCSKN